MTEQIHQAIYYAGKRHAGQVRKGTSVPYLVHPMEVMGILIENNCSEDVVVAGILHDVIEDTCDDNDIIRDIVRAEIQNKFGEHVLSIVNSESEDKSKTWKERKQHTIDALADDSFEVQAVCCADKLSNIMSIYADVQSSGEKVWSRFNAPKDNLHWYYQSVYEHLTKIDETKYPMEKQLGEFVAKVFTK